MSRCLAIFHKQLGDLVLLEPTLKRLARASGSSVDLITRSGFQPLISLMPYVNFRRTASRRAYEALWCFDDRKKSAFYALVSGARQKHLLINPGARLRWYHSMIFPHIPFQRLWTMDAGRVRLLCSTRSQKHSSLARVPGRLNKKKSQGPDTVLDMLIS